ncbi:MAG TPA: amidohydrolase family protein [Acidimicrobiales bacterium]
MTEPVVDTHTHVVSDDHSRYPLTPPEGLPRMSWFEEHPVTAEQLVEALDAGGVAGAVVVQAKGAYGFDNSYAADAQALAPGRLVSASIIDMESPNRLDQLNYWAADRGMLGTRLFDIPTSSPSWLNDPATATVLNRARDLGIRISLCVLEGAIPLVGELLDLAPDIPMALDHCGFADMSGPPPYAAAAPLFALNRHANLRLKVTTTQLAPGQAEVGDPRDVLEHLCEVFGAERLMWGSDYPQHHSEPYPEIVALAHHACSRLSPTEQARFLSGTAVELWPELAAATS